MVYKAVPLSGEDHGDISGRDSDNVAVITVFTLALENVICLTIALMDVPADRAALFQSDMAEKPALIQHFPGSFKNGMEYSFAGTALNLTA